ncbi:MAG: chemotaxis protein CheW [Pseudomonadota bacterium]
MAEIARNLDQADKSAAMVSKEGQLVVFRLAEEEFGVDIGMVKEIVRMPEITPMPRSPEFVAGICNLRGNILPVIDTRTRFSMPPGEKSDHTRLLVVDLDGAYMGLIVDAMREVMRMSNSLVEPPPAVCEGVDSKFLDGVVKMDDGRRLVLKLNMWEVVAIDGQSAGGARAGGGPVGARDRGGPDQAESMEEAHMVSFNLAGEEYAFDIAKVREILKVPEITAVPNVPEYVKGLFTIRNQLLPIIDLRRMLGLPELVTEYHLVLDRAMEEQRRLGEKIINDLELGRQSTSPPHPGKTWFGTWLSRYDTSSVEIEQGIKRLEKRREDFHLHAQEVIKSRSAVKDGADVEPGKYVGALSQNVLDVMMAVKQAVAEYHGEDQRVMVVEAAGLYVGYLVDSVNEVMRIPRTFIDDTPTMAASQRKEVKGVARLEEGGRLVMIMDEQTLVTREAGRAIEKIRDRQGESGSGNMIGKSSAAGRQNIEEEQLVTFGIAEQEYGVPIMQVQEINRISDITAIPRAPYFIDGVTNLRGHVIPVINIRRLFGLPGKDIDDRTRVIIVDIDGNKTGLRVDNVNEVLRLPKSEIEKTPGIVTASGANKFMVGVCKIKDGRQIITLLDIKKILDQKETAQLGAMKDRQAEALDRDESDGGAPPADLPVEAGRDETDAPSDDDQV